MAAIITALSGILIHRRPPFPFHRVDELGSNYADLSRNFEEACAESQRLQLRNLGLAQEVQEQQGDLVEVRC